MGGTSHIVVVGAGPGGLTAAMILARRGFRVTVFEAQPRLGGRNGEFQQGPYRFDIGPTFLMLKPILDEVIQEAGGNPADLPCTPLSPLYRLVFQDRELHVFSDPDAMTAEIARVFPGKESRYALFRRREKGRFRRLYPCLQKSYHRFATFFHPDFLLAIPHLALGKTLFDVVSDTFQDETLALAFTFQSKYLGMSPWECPGVFAMIPYIEHEYGIEHPKGGLTRISDFMADLARRNGATIHLQTPVRQIRIRHRRADAVVLENGETVAADAIVLNADFGHAVTHLFEPGALRKYTPARLDRMRLSCSTFMLYLGVEGVFQEPHHQIVFARDYRTHIQSVFSSSRLPKDLSFYIRNASLTDPTLAPPGHSALYVLVPVPNLRIGVPWHEEKAAFRERVLDAIASRTGYGDLRPRIRAEICLAPPDWENTLRVYRGATFNLAHTIDQMLYFRPRNQFEECEGLYLTGGGTHPGSGLPTIYESGRIAANLISRRAGISFESSNRHI